MKRKSIKDFSAIVGSNFINYPITLVKSFLVAKFLGPEDYGILQSTKLITMLNKFGKLGFSHVAVREVGVLKGNSQPNITKENLIKNTAYSSEVVLAALLTITGIVISLFSPPKYTLIICIASIGMFVKKMSGLLTIEATIQRRFILIAKITFITNLFISIIVSLTVPIFKIYAALTTPVIVTGIICFFYKNKLGFNYRFYVEKKEFIRQLKIGIPLTVGTFAYGSYIYIERILIISYLTLSDLGYFGFAIMVANQFISIFLTAIKVRKMNILEYLGRGDFYKVNKLVIKETTILLIGSLFVIIFVWLFTIILIPIFLQKYIEAIVIANIYILVLPFKVLSSYLAIVIKSPIVNKQNVTPLFQFFSTGFLLLATVMLNHYELLTLKLYVVVDLIGYAFVHISFVLMYYKYFYKDIVRKIKSDVEYQ